jgi:hypothetical protein
VKQLTVDGREVPHPPPPETIGGFQLPRWKKEARQMSEGTQSGADREMEETTEPVVETPAEGGEDATPGVGPFETSAPAEGDAPDDDDDAA